MTAVASYKNVKESLTVFVDMRSYNSRYLDIAVNIPYGYQYLEDKIKKLISGRIERGRLDIKLQIKDDSGKAHTFEVNIQKAKAYHDKLLFLKNEFKLDSGIPLDLLALQEGIIIPAEIDPDTEACWHVVKDCINKAIDDLVAMRKKEGEFIAQDIAKRLDYIKKCIDNIAKEASGLLPFYQQRLLERISLLTKGIAADIETERIAQEAAFLANRSDITEELVRVKSHLKQFFAIMDSEEQAGKKLNFLLQEFNREFNTMGSKAEKANMSHIIVDVKFELERIREQVQNVE